MTPELELLRSIALQFKVDPINTTAHAARVDSLLQSLGGIQLSFKSFIKAEFLKNADFEKEYQRSPKVLDTVLDKLELLVVDLQFSSAYAALAPDITETQSSMFVNEVLDWQKEEFKRFKTDIVYGDFSNADYVREVAEKYTEEERTNIFSPLFKAAGDGSRYRVKLLNQKEEKERVLTPPPIEFQRHYVVPRVRRYVAEDDFETVQVFAKVKRSGGAEELRKKDIKEFYYWEKLEHPTYPFKTSFLRFKDRGYILREALTSAVSYEEGQFFITNEMLDITVWADTRDEAEEAFAFSFDSLYRNYAEEADDRLTEDAKLLKQSLLHLVSDITISKS